jgi:hypothetical protein
VVNACRRNLRLDDFDKWITSLGLATMATSPPCWFLIVAERSSSGWKHRSGGRTSRGDVARSEGPRTPNLLIRRNGDAGSYWTNDLAP